MEKEKIKQKRTAIGGQALLEGVMMRGKTAMAMAVRTPDGIPLVETQRLKPKRKAAKIPIIRGAMAFFSSLVLGVTCITRSANVAAEEDEKIGSAGVAISVIAGLAIAIIVFFFLPGLASEFFYNKVTKNVLLKNLLSGALRVGMFIGYLFLVSLLKDIRRTFMYHGAEHKTINCFEKGLPLSVENARACSTRHNRCGTTFMFLVMVVSILVFAVADYALYKLFNLKGAARTAVFMGIKLLLLPIVAGFSYEVLFAFAKMPDNAFSKVLRAPGLALQRLTTYEPDDGMLEVAITAFEAVQKMDDDQSIATQKFEEIPTQRFKNEAAEKLAGIGAEECEADWMLSHVTGLSRSNLAAKTTLTYKEYKALKDLLAEREHKPLDYCLGVSNFFGREIKVDEHVLIPRFETETLAEAAIKIIGENSLEVLDLCTGSGCISLVLAKETTAKITASDLSEKALEIAKENLKETEVTVVQSDLFSELNGKTFDLIVSNPPYIKSGEIDFLQKEVRVQPRMALDGGKDGLDFYRRIAKDAPQYLKDGGILLMEIGQGQFTSIKGLLLISGFKEIEVFNDLQKIERIVVARV